MKKVLLYEDFSHLHATLAEGLRELGINVTVASSGDGWKNTARDIDLLRTGKIPKLKLLREKLFSSKFRNYDVLQFINCYSPLLGDNVLLFLLFFSIMRKNNKKLFLGAFGDDYYALHSSLYCGQLSYFVDHMPIETVTDEYALNVLKTLNTRKGRFINQYVAEKCDRIIAGCYDYYVPYEKLYKNKLSFIPFPINTDKILYTPNIVNNGKIRILVGKQKGRTEWKGIDIIYDILVEYEKKYPNEIQLVEAENVPFEEYKELVKSSNVMVDQLYASGQGINALISLAMGKITLTGGAPEQYEMVGEYVNRPITGVTSNREQIRQQLDTIISRKKDFEEWGFNCRKYVEDHHHYVKVAEKYLLAWQL
jgi:hypothetical protein